jgi:dienelactone hydrolase
MVRLVLAILVAWGIAVTSALAETREQVSIPVQGQRTLLGEIFLPDGTGPTPAVIVLHTAYGSVETFDSDFARALAKAGFVALAVNYLHPEVTSGNRNWVPAITADLVAVTNWLKSRPEVGGKPVGTVGFSLGSHGLILSARHQGIKAVVVYYGGYNPRQYRSVKLPPNVRLPIDVAREVEAAVLLFHGEADDEVPLSDAQAMKAALDGAGKTVELVTYPGAYHRFDRGPVAGMRGERSPQGHTYRKNDAAAKDAFQRTIDWLKKHLGS